MRKSEQLFLTMPPPLRTLMVIAVDRLADDVVYIPKTIEMFEPILAVVPLQLFAYYFAAAKGFNVDRPRNLAKSVTVE